MKSLTQARVRELFDYNPVEKELIWKVNINQVRVGDIAGWVSDNGYLIVGIDCRQHRVHRVIFLWMTGRFPDDDIDHIDQNRLNNCWSNLRDATRSENMKNAILRNDNKSGRVGVCWDRSRNKWTATIGLKKRQKHLGRFEDFDEACKVRAAAEIQYGFLPNHGRKAA